MTEEKELLTILSQDEFGEVLNNFENKFGKPKIKKRLALQSDDYDNAEIDTRIRITDGKAELMQKIGDWKNITKGKSRTEISVSLPSDADTIAGLYRIIRNLMNGESVENIIMQFENYIWVKDNFEIKLTHQSGGSDAYNCEIEVFDDALSPLKLAKEYSVPIHLPTETQDFWRKWNARVNINANNLTDDEIKEIIKSYLN